MIRPSSLRIGAPLSAMGRSVPSRAIKRVWLASPTTVPSRTTRTAGFSTSARVCSLMMRNTCSRGLSNASASGQPVSCSATRIHTHYACRRVGGDDGVANAVKGGADLLLGLAPLDFPHDAGPGKGIAAGR